MKKFTKHTPEQIVARLEQARKLKKQGKNNADICRELGISEATLSRWHRDYGDMNHNHARELKRLRAENATLKNMLGQAELEKAALRELAEGKF